MSIMYRINATVLGSKNAESDAGEVVGKQIKPGEANAGEEQAGKEKEQEEAKQESGNSGLGGLTGYGESDDESSQSEPEDESLVHPQKNTEPPFDHVVADETAKEARRARARRWAEERRAKRAEGNE